MDYTTEIINISKMREGFFIGDRIAGTSLDVVIQFKITHMINAAGSEIINQFESIGIKYLTLNWSENPKQALFDSKDEIANRIVQFIDESLKNGEGILAHSVRGQDRVCIVVIIYLMRKYNWSLRKCIEFLQSKKQDIDIPKFFLEQLYNFGIRLEQYNLGKKKENWIDDGNYVDSDEKLMRNTYVNGLPSDKNVKSDIGKKKKKKVGWADNNPYGKNDYLFSCNLQKDLFLMKDIKPVNNHIRMRPSRSCVKNKSKSIGNEKEYISLKDNNIGNNNNMVNRDNQDEGNNRIYNIQPIKQNEIFRDEMYNNINQITFGLDSNILEQINNINNTFNNLTIPKNNNNNSNNINNNNIMNNSLKTNQNFNNTVKPQKPVKQTQQYISNPVFNSLNNGNNKLQNKPLNQNINQNPKRMNNFPGKENNNFEIPKRANSQNQNPNMKNYINLPGQINMSNNNNNYKNYSVVKEQNNFQNDNNNNKVIFTQNYEQIVTNNINNFFIQNPEMINQKNNNNRIPIQENIRMYNKNFNEQSINQEVSSIKKQLNNYINNPISPTQKIQNNQIRNNNVKTNNNIIMKNNFQGKKPITYNNYFLNENLQEIPNDMGKYKVIDYSSDYDPSNIIMRNIMNNPQQRNINNNNNNINNMQNKNQFLGGINNYNPKKNTTHVNQNYFGNKNPNNIHNSNNNVPLNNFNPSLVRKAKTPLFTRQPNANSGPVKIQKDFKKPTTPDNINRNIIRPGNMRVNYNNNINSYNPIHRPNKKNNNEAIKRPSTAPQKDKNNNMNNNNNINRNNMKGKNNNNIYGNYMGQSIKRAPSPMIQSHNMGINMNRTQKFNPAVYRAPSPMIKSTTLSLDPFKRTKY